MTGVDEAWTRIVAWLGSNAPRTAALLKPPATEADIAAAEAAVGSPFPVELHQLYRRVNGMQRTGPVLPPYNALYPLAEALDVHRIQVALAADADEDPDEAESLWQEYWFPLAADTGSTTLFVDLRAGFLGEYDKVFGWDGKEVWPDLTTALSRTAAALESSGTCLGYRVEVAEEMLQWRLPDGLWLDQFGWIVDDRRREFGTLLAHVRSADLDDSPEAELVAARVALTVDRLVAAGDDPAAGYDDPDQRDEPALRAYADERGGLPGLDAHLSESVERLFALAEPYAHDHGESWIPDREPRIRATVRESGDIVVDGPVSWPGLLAGVGWLVHQTNGELGRLRAGSG